MAGGCGTARVPGVGAGAGVPGALAREAAAVAGVEAGTTLPLPRPEHPVIGRRARRGKGGGTWKEAAAGGGGWGGPGAGGGCGRPQWCWPGGGGPGAAGSPGPQMEGFMSWGSAGMKPSAAAQIVPEADEDKDGGGGDEEGEEEAEADLP